MRPRSAVLLTRNPTKDFYPERPSGVKDLSSSHMSIPICHSPPSLALTKNTAPFVFKRLRTLPSSVSCKSCSCRSYANFASRTVLRDANGRVCTNNSRSGTLRSALVNPTLDYFAGAAGFFLSAHSALSVVSALNPSFPFFRLSTFNFELSTSSSNLSPFFSNSCGLFCAQQKLNSFVFKQFRTLCTKHPGVGWRRTLRFCITFSLQTAQVPCFCRLQNSTGRRRRPQSTTLSRLRH